MTGRARRRSDVDVGVLCAGPADLDELYRLLAPCLASTRVDLVDLRPMRAMPLADYRARVWERKGIERVLQEAIEAALDVNAHLIAERGEEVPDDYFGGFVKLGDLGVLPRELARVLAPSAGLRNRLMHEYDTLDDAKVLAAVGTMLDLYPRYIAAIEGELTRLGV